MAAPALLLLLVALVSGQHVEITPRTAVRAVGEDLTVICKVAYSIDSCRMAVGGGPSYIMREDPNNSGDIVYAGKGLREGECGATFRHIREDWNGNISCSVPPQSGNIEVVGTMRLIVARAPTDVQLNSPAQPSFRAGDRFVAMCVVPESRPVARITWYLGENQLLKDIHQANVSLPTSDDLQTITQNITLFLTPEDDGLRLTCRAEHEALSRPREASRQLMVQYPPKAQEQSPITMFGLKLSSEGRLNVTVRANPPPLAEWTVSGQRLVPPQSSNDGSILALPPVALGGGFYNVTLVLARVSKEDVDRTYFLKVGNILGEEKISVHISTMDEPAGVELDAGAIVGIVVGVLVLLLAVFLVVFAKATDRWCFAGSRTRDHTKSSGESSDTESAVGGRMSRLAGLGARVRAALPRGKDKVQATDTQEADKPLDEKKGVVYAELALGDQSAEKPQPPTTEYAEIVYTDQPKETKE